MKRLDKKMVWLGTIVLTVGLAVGCAANAPDIGKEKAVQIALGDADVKSQEDTSRFRATLDSEDGRNVYEITFTVEDIEYDYEVQASDGKILNVSEKLTGANGTGTEAVNATEGITWEEAAKLALERVKGATKDDLRMNLEKTETQETYDGNIIYEGTEYDFEIDPKTGKFLEWGKESR